jgi:superfamily II DNA or RNA helicase
MNDITLIIREQTWVINPPEFIQDKIAMDLTFNNPAYKRALVFGNWIGQDVPKYLRYFDHNQSKDKWIVPKGYTYFLIKTLRKYKLNYKIVDKTLLLPNIEFTFKGDSRDYQDESLESMCRYPVGVLKADTGSGKTVMALKMIAIRKQPTLILVHTKELLNQWKKRIKDFLDIDCGLIGDNKFEIKPVTVGIINSVSNHLEKIKERFGFIICDETHRAPSQTWIDVISELPARYFLGLSATPFRADKLDKVIYAFVGPQFHEVDREKHIQVELFFNLILSGLKLDLIVSLLTILQG